MRTMNLKSIFTALLTILGLTLGSIAMAAGPDKDDDDKSGNDSYQLPQAGGDTDKDDDKKDDDGW